MLGFASEPVAESISVVTANADVISTVFSDIAATHFVTIRGLMLALDSLHSTGLPWAGAIVALTFILRLCLVPVLIYSSKVGVRMAMMRPDLEELNAEFNRRKALNLDARENSASYSRGMLALYQKHRCHPMSALVMPMVSMPLFISCFFALNGLCTEGVAGMNTGGVLWFQDLTAMDPYFLLPVLSSWSGVLILKRGSESGGVIDPKVMPMIKIITVVGLFAPLVTYQLPSGVLLYFTAMSVFSLFQGEIIRADATRRMLGMPTLSEMRIMNKVPGYTPFKDDSGPGLPPSVDSEREKAGEDAKDKKAARKKQLPLPFKKR